ncbi:hypothetical protein [Nocardia sp. NPDC048505]|uniref:hypothetical protein n=1 Tax=unclassified Nocardia TaxID=2637762 RepID=UPI0033CC4084
MPHLAVTGPLMLAPMGMDKNTNQTVKAATVNQQLINWVNRSGFGRTRIVDNALVMNAAGRVRVRCGVQLTAVWSSFDSELSVSLMHNTTVLRTAKFADTAVLTLPETQLDVRGGDQLWIRMTNAGGVFNGDAVVKAGNGTFLTSELG